MRNEGLGSWPARRARMTPHRAALVHRDRTLSYGALHERATRLAHGLRALGVGRGERVAYLGPNHPAFLETLFAAGALGAVFVPLNARLTASEAAFQLADCQAAALVHTPSHAGLVAQLPDPAACAPTRLGVGPGYEEFLAQASAEPLDEPVGLDEPCVIMYTSGTTGSPKGAVLTHGNLTWNTLNVLIDLDLTAEERALVAAPLFHAAGLGMLALPVLLKGGSCLLLERFDAAETLELIGRHRVSFMFGVPTMFEMMTREEGWQAADLSSLRTLTCGGAPVPDSLLAAYRDRGLTLQQGYGMTECGPGALLVGRDQAVTKAGSAGVPHFFTDVRVARPDLTPVGAGETGEVLVSGPNVMSGYWQAPQASQECFAEGGWFRSGDVARVDEDGHVHIVDRLKDVIISGGENVYPAEIENLLLAHPDIAECAVIGVPDEKWGEVPRAVVVPREDATLDAETVLTHLSGRVARYKIPRSVVITRSAEPLPRTASGKLRKPLLRELYGAR